MGAQRFIKTEVIQYMGPLEKKNILLGKSKANLFSIKIIKTFQKYKTPSLGSWQIIKY